MNLPTQICSKCHQDFMSCSCEQFHPNIDSGVCKHGTALDVHCCNCHSGFLFDIDSCVCFNTHFTTQELRVLYQVLEHHYIPYENQEAHNVVNKIAKILKENELDRTSSSIKK